MYICVLGKQYLFLMGLKHKMSNTGPYEFNTSTPLACSVFVPPKIVAGYIDELKNHIDRQRKPWTKLDTFLKKNKECLLYDIFYPLKDTIKYIEETIIKKGHEAIVIELICKLIELSSSNSKDIGSGTRDEQTEEEDDEKKEGADANTSSTSSSSSGSSTLSASDEDEQLSGDSFKDSGGEDEQEEEEEELDWMLMEVVYGLMDDAFVGGQKIYLPVSLLSSSDDITIDYVFYARQFGYAITQSFFKFKSNNFKSSGDVFLRPLHQFKSDFDDLYEAYKKYKGKYGKRYPCIVLPYLRALSSYVDLVEDYQAAPHKWMQAERWARAVQKIKRGLHNFSTRFNATVDTDKRRALQWTFVREDFVGLNRKPRQTHRKDFIETRKQTVLQLIHVDRTETMLYAWLCDPEIGYQAMIQMQGQNHHEDIMSREIRNLFKIYRSEFRRHQAKKEKFLHTSTLDAADLFDTLRTSTIGTLETVLCKIYPLGVAIAAALAVTPATRSMDTTYTGDSMRQYESVLSVLLFDITLAVDTDVSNAFYVAISLLNNLTWLYPSSEVKDKSERSSLYSILMSQINPYIVNNSAQRFFLYSLLSSESSFQAKMAQDAYEKCKFHKWNQDTTPDAELYEYQQENTIPDDCCGTNTLTVLRDLDEYKSMLANNQNRRYDTKRTEDVPVNTTNLISPTKRGGSKDSPDPDISFDGDGNPPEIKSLHAIDATGDDYRGYMARKPLKGNFYTSCLDGDDIGQTGLQEGDDVPIVSTDGADTESSSIDNEGDSGDGETSVPVSSTGDSPVSLGPPDGNAAGEEPQPTSPQEDDNVQIVSTDGADAESSSSDNDDNGDVGNTNLSVSSTGDSPVSLGPPDGNAAGEESQLTSTPVAKRTRSKIRFTTFASPIKLSADTEEVGDISLSRSVLDFQDDFEEINTTAEAFALQDPLNQSNLNQSTIQNVKYSLTFFSEDQQGFYYSREQAGSDKYLKALLKIMKKVKSELKPFFEAGVEYQRYCNYPGWQTYRNDQLVEPTDSEGSDMSSTAEKLKQYLPDLKDTFTPKNRRSARTLFKRGNFDVIQKDQYDEFLVMILFPAALHFLSTIFDQYEKENKKWKPHYLVSDDVVKKIKKLIENKLKDEKGP